MNRRPVTLVRNRDGWRPREEFSPSQLVMADRCFRAWALRYLHGVKPLQKELGKMLGSMIHWCMRRHVRGYSIYEYQLRGDEPPDLLEGWAELQKELAEFPADKVAELWALAPDRARVMIPYLPAPEDIAWFEDETPFTLNTSEFFPEFEPFKFSSKSSLDLLTGLRSGEIVVHDYKSTRGRTRRYNGKPPNPWAYVPLADKLARDCQCALYLLAVMQRFQLESVWGCWIYALTDIAKPPQACDVRLRITRAEAIHYARPWIVLADTLRQAVRLATAFGRPPRIESLSLPAGVYPAEDGPCMAYGGCEYIFERGGPCSAGNPLAAMLAQ